MLGHLSRGGVVVRGFGMGEHGPSRKTNVPMQPREYLLEGVKESNHGLVYARIVASEKRVTGSEQEDC